VSTEDELLKKIALYKVQMLRTCQLFRETDSIFSRHIFRKHIEVLEDHVKDIQDMEDNKS